MTKKALNIIGVMSGTSMDGIDLALINTDGVEVFSRKESLALPFPDGLRAELLDLLGTPIPQDLSSLNEIEARLSQSYKEAIEQYIEHLGLSHEDIDFVGLHGQTLWHDPARGITVQLGDGAWLARALGIDIINQFRIHDVKMGGEGAPLAPIYHQALARGLPEPVAFLNLGGVANISYIDGETLIAFDTGPASAMIDDYMRQYFGKPYDKNGETAKSGQANRAVIGEFLKNPYFQKPAPKSLDRQSFHGLYARISEFESKTDAVATLSQFTIESILCARIHLPRPPKTWVLCGGGRKNSYIVDGLRRELGDALFLSESFGIDGDALEAECFAFLAARSLYGLPISFPSTTGVPSANTGGTHHKAQKNRP